MFDYLRSRQESAADRGDYSLPMQMARIPLLAGLAGTMVFFAFPGGGLANDQLPPPSVSPGETGAAFTPITSSLVYPPTAVKGSDGREC
jgi:hypothetical protein